MRNRSIQLTQETNMTEYSDVDSLRLSIIDAFSHDSETFPIDDNLRRLAKETPYDDSRELFQSLIGKKWKDLRQEDAASSDPWLTLLPREIFHYFLPGLMNLALSSNASWEFRIGLIDSLCPPSPAGKRPQIGANTEAMSHKQIKCLSDFLKWCNEDILKNTPKIARRCDRAICEIERTEH